VIQRWERGWTLFANATGGCVHCEPVLPDCSPDEEVSVHGEVLFAEGDPGDWAQD
jgi:hypothetical protein